MSSDSLQKLLKILCPGAVGGRNGVRGLIGGKFAELITNIITDKQELECLRYWDIGGLMPEHANPAL